MTTATGTTTTAQPRLRHDDHGHGHDDHGHDDHGHGHDDHGHGHDDHGHGHDDHGHGHDDHGHGNMNLRGAFLHVIGDCLQSLGVVLAAGFIWGMNNRYHNDPASARSYANLADPCCSVLFGVITMFTTINLFRDIFRVLMQCTPRGIDYDKVLSELKEVPNVRAVQDLHLWSLGSEDSVLMAHLVVSGNSEMAVLKKVMKDSESVGKRCKVDHVTIQLVFDDQ
jgi:zinc transporter 2